MRMRIANKTILYMRYKVFYIRDIDERDLYYILNLCKHIKYLVQIMNF